MFTKELPALTPPDPAGALAAASTGAANPAAFDAFTFVGTSNMGAANEEKVF